MKEYLYLFDESFEIAQGIKSAPAFPGSIVSKPFAFAFDSEIEEQEKELISKIITSVNQDESNTIKILFGSQTCSLSKLNKIGIKYFIIFSDSVPDIFSSLLINQNEAFELSGVECFITKSIKDFNGDAQSKNKLWSYMKSKL